MMDIGETKVCGTVRMGRGVDSFRAQECALAGKRGKVCPRYSVDAWPTRQDSDAFSAFAAFLDAVVMLPYAAGRDLAQALCAANKGFNFWQDEDKAVRVAPVAFETLEVNGEHVHVTAEYESFRVADKDDRNNEPRLIPPCHGGAVKAARAFHAWAAGHRDALATMTFSQVWSAMQAAGIDSHHYCAMD
jgi:hypothetical protein